MTFELFESHLKMFKEQFILINVIMVTTLFINFGLYGFLFFETFIHNIGLL